MTMTHNTSISKRRLGPPRFESDPEQTRPGEVKTYTLSPEELEKYKNLPKPDGKKPIDLRFRFNPKKKEEPVVVNENGKITTELTKGRYHEHKKHGKSDNAIIGMYEGMNYPKLKKLKEQWGLIDGASPEDDPKQEASQTKQPPRPASVVAKLDQLEDLQKQLDEKEKEVNSYLLIIDSLKKDLNKKSEMINLLKSLLREVL